MDIILQIVFSAIIGLVLIGFIKEQAPEFTVLCVIAIIVLLTVIIYPLVADGVNRISEILDKSGTRGIVMPVIKVLGITSVMKMISDMCIDAGEKAIGHITEIVGIICALMAIGPLVTELIENIGNII